MDTNCLSEKLFEKKMMQFITDSIEKKLGAVKPQGVPPAGISENTVGRLQDLEKVIRHLNKQIRTEKMTVRNSSMKRSCSDSTINFNTADDGIISAQFPVPAQQNKSFYD